MGVISRIEGPVFIDGQQSVGLAREAAKDAEEGWSVTRRPYREPISNEMFRDTASDWSPSTCLLAGNRVLLADGSSKAIETIRAGETVMTMSGPKLVEKTEATTLGLTRRVLEIRGLGDEALFLSSDHPLWVSRRDKEGRRKEWWGTYNIHHVLYEMHNGTGLEFQELPFILNFDLPEQVAHASGWLHVRPIFHDLPPSTELFHLVVQDGFSYVAEGFPVLSHCRDQQGPASPWAGLEGRSSASETVRQLIPCIG
ncbi:hypothetical protein [Ramlibacter alkalitolerans]|uniref:Hint domain-containing protein n=1 Tax=Ramlibacter alkalitolerans TaxID=2039631 RepID=A0ABS1JQW0_9BURK|nr:hypothetical protein [Ramlibacter alkalitolerans]MBL0426640.1 hypothetical protein [Ramlibacter alkalitolerans]